MSRKRHDELASWTGWIRDALALRARTARLTYDDKVDGDVLLLAIEPSSRDQLVEISVARRKKGHPHLAVMATTEQGIRAASEALQRMHVEISRVRNAKRKFVHRIERMVDVLARTWTARAQSPGQDDDAFRAALGRLQETMPETAAMRGVGFHVDMAGADDHHTKKAYPTLRGAVVPVAVPNGTEPVPGEIATSWRGLAWDPQQGRWLARAGTFNALMRGKTAEDLERAGISLGDLATGAAVGAAVVAAALSGSNLLDDEIRQADRKESCWADAIDPCEIADCTLSLADLGNFVPDCDVGSFDCGGLDCGGLDCSL